MRKFLAVILAVLMLVSIVLPVAAEEETVNYDVSTDGTKAEDADKLPLVITEYYNDTTSPQVGIQVQEGETDPLTYNAFQFIEVYNAGSENIDLYNVAIAAAYNGKSESIKENPWETTHTYTKKMSLHQGSIYTDINFADNAAKEKYTNNVCFNPVNGVLGAGQLAVIWFWNDYTDIVSDAAVKLGYESYGATVNNVTHARFRELMGIPEDVLVIAVYAGTDKEGGAGSVTTTGSRFMLNVTGGAHQYALIDESSFANGWDLGTVAWTVAKGWHDAIISTWEWGVNTRVGLRATEGKSTVFAPANKTPDLFNRIEKMSLEGKDLENFVPAKNYYEIGYVDGFKEMAVVSFDETPTPGTMNDWQWAYVDPDSAYVTGKLNGATFEEWSAALIKTYIEAAAPELEAEVEKEEEEIDLIFKDRDDLGNQGQNALDPVDDGEGKGGMNTIVLIIIIVAAVVVVAGVAVVLILVLKKKKPVAADDVATERDVVVIDENKTEE